MFRYETLKTREHDDYTTIAYISEVTIGILKTTQMFKKIDDDFCFVIYVWLISLFT